MLLDSQISLVAKLVGRNQDALLLGGLRIGFKKHEAYEHGWRARAAAVVQAGAA